MSAIEHRVTSSAWDTSELTTKRRPPKAKKPEFGQLSQLQEKALHGRLLATRALVSHSPTKGRGLEEEVAAVLREMLPFEYGVSGLDSSLITERAGQCCPHSSTSSSMTP